jgi:sugar phosphate isomerase/epimerase
MSPFPLSGLADEAADDIDGQIAAHQALGWKALELRLLNGKQFSGPAVSDDEFKQAIEKIEAAGMRVSSYASAIGNWSRPITGDFATDLADLKVLIPRMRRTGTKFVRTMSWVRGEVSEDAWRDEGVRRYKEMAKLAADGGIMLLHENCEGWGGTSPDNARAFMESVDHPNVRYLFDIGNTVSYGLPTLPFYEAVKPFIAYVHVKDARRNPVLKQTEKSLNRWLSNPAMLFSEQLLVVTRRN